MLDNPPSPLKVDCPVTLLTEEVTFGSFQRVNVSEEDLFLLAVCIDFGAVTVHACVQHQLWHLKGSHSDGEDESSIHPMTTAHSSVIIDPAGVDAAQGGVVEILPPQLFRIPQLLAG